MCNPPQLLTLSPRAAGRSGDSTALYVNLFVSSTVTWAERNVVVRQHTDFPYSDTSRLSLAGEGAFDIKVRAPRWATQGFFVKINGVPQTVDAVPGTYLSLSRAWKHNDTIELRMPLHFHLCRLMDRPNIGDVILKPFYETNGHHSVYLDVTLE